MFLCTAVIITLFLTANTMIQNLFGWLVTGAHTTESTFEVVKFSLSGVIAVGTILALFLLTSLGKSVWTSLACDNSSENNNIDVEINSGTYKSTA